jgi:hypothetical protein
MHHGNALRPVACHPGITGRPSGPDRQICSQRFRVDRSSCKRISRSSGSNSFTAEIRCRQSCYGAIGRGVNSLQPRDLIRTQRP